MDAFYNNTASCALLDSIQFPERKEVSAILFESFFYFLDKRI